MRAPGRTRRLGLLWLVLFALAVPSLAHGAPYHQLGVDAGRTGVSADPGPAWGDVAIRLRLPAGRAPDAPPLVLGTHAFVLTLDKATNTSAIHRIDLDSARVSVHARLDVPGSAFATDGTRFFVTTPHGVRAFDTANGSPVWSTALSTAQAPARVTRCLPPAVDAGRVHVVCEVADYASGPVDDAPQPVVTVATLAAGDGKAVRERTVSWKGSGPLYGSPQAPGLPFGPDNAQFAQGAAADLDLVLALVRVERGAMDVDGRRLVESHARLVAYHTAEQSHVWRIDTEPAVRNPASSSRAHAVATTPVTDGERVYARLAPGEITVLEAATGAVIERHAVGAGAPPEFAMTGTTVLGRDALFVTSGDVLERIPREGGAATWSVRAPPGDVWAQDRMVKAGHVLLAAAATPEPTADMILVPPSPGRNADVLRETATTLHAFDADSGTRLWSVHVGAGAPAPRRDLFAVGDGVVVTASVDGNLTVIGRTAASPVAHAAVTPASPEPGDVVRVDLSGSMPGLLGPVTAYRAEWGDGTVTPWQVTPVLTHRYEAKGVFPAVFSVRNDAGQTASHLVTVRTDVASVDLAGATTMPRLHPAWTALLAVGVGLVVTVGVRAQRERALVATAVPRPGARFLRKYRIERELGRGAFGSAWLATRLKDKRRVVVKQLHAELASDAKARQRFLREARILQELDHAHVTRVLAVEHAGRKEDAPLFIVLEFLDGGSAQALIAPGASLSTTSAWDDTMTQDWGASAAPAGVPPEDAVRVTADVLAGLAHVHARGIVHRDVKPSNVLLTAEGRAKVADFGIAKSPDVAATLASTAGGPQPGTLAYMAPEVVRGVEADTRADLYSAAVVFVHLVTGRFYLGPRPVDEFELRRRILEARPQLTGVPPALAQWAARALAKAPHARWPSADAMRDALLAAAREDGVTDEE